MQAADLPIPDAPPVTITDILSKRRRPGMLDIVTGDVSPIRHQIGGLNHVF